MKFLALVCFVIVLYLGSHAGESDGRIITTLNLRLTGQNSDRQTYAQFIVNLLRRSLPVESRLVYRLPVLSLTTLGEAFLYLRLSYHQQVVTLAMDAANLYILGSAVHTRTQNVSFFFNDVPQSTRQKLFNDTTRRTLSYGVNYGSLGNRSNTPIGIPALGAAIVNMYTTNNEPPSSAYLVTLQMIAEAGRFKYIERQITNKPGTVLFDFIPNPKILSLQNNWGKLSKQIQEAQSNSGNFKFVVLITAENGRDVIRVTNVNSPVVTEDIAILLNYRTQDSVNQIVTVTPSDVVVETAGGGGADVYVELTGNDIAAM